ncbi:hypothetical protein GYMLUDRAFT_257613 [Collybiopsis luxurians FD-317 M1]|nr:hypothetical protein GYMLUDRAFT_257613 [Collybiopsis luxurians FD-317 M1]
MRASPTAYFSMVIVSRTTARIVGGTGRWCFVPYPQDIFNVSYTSQSTSKFALDGCAADADDPVRSFGDDDAKTVGVAGIENHSGPDDIPSSHPAVRFPLYCIIRICIHTFSSSPFPLPQNNVHNPQPRTLRKTAPLYHVPVPHRHLLRKVILPPYVPIALTAFE